MLSEDSTPDGLGAVACTDTFVFASSLGPCGRCFVLRACEDSVKYVGALGPVYGTFSRLFVTKRGTRLVGNTSCGCLYVWDVGPEALDKLESLTYDPLYNDGFIPPGVRPEPLVQVTPEDSDHVECIAIVPGLDIILVLLKSGALELSTLDLDTGNVIAKFGPLLESKPQSFSCLAVSRKKWVLLGTHAGLVGLLHLDVDNKSVGRVYTLKIAELNVAISSLDFRPGGSNITILAGCSDGILRCVIVQPPAPDDTELTVLRQASYTYAKGGVAKANITRLITLPHKVPTVVAACNAQLHYSLYNSKGNETRFTHQCIYQQLVPNESDNIVAIGNLDDTIIDVAASPTGDTIVASVANQSLYISKRLDPPEDGNIFTQMQKINWKPI